MSDNVYVKWSFPLHPDLDSLVAEKDSSRPKKRPGLINRTEIVGYLTENRCGIVIDPDKDPVMGYYLVDALSMIGLEHFGDDDERLDPLWARYSRLLTLVYMDSTTEEPEVVGVFDPATWEEECLTKSTVALTYRVPAPHGEEYRERTTEYDISQVTAITDTIWQKLRAWRIDSLTCGLPNTVILGNGEEWVPDTSEKYLPIPEHAEV